VGRMVGRMRDGAWRCVSELHTCPDTLSSCNTGSNPVRDTSLINTLDWFGELPRHSVENGAENAAACGGVRLLTVILSMRPLPAWSANRFVACHAATPATLALSYATGWSAVRC